MIRQWYTNIHRIHTHHERVRLMQFPLIISSKKLKLLKTNPGPSCKKFQTLKFQTFTQSLSSCNLMNYSNETLLFPSPKLANYYYEHIHISRNKIFRFAFYQSRKVVSEINKSLSITAVKNLPTPHSI